MAQDDQEKMGSILHQDEFYLPLQFSSPCALLFSTMKEVYYILGLKQKKTLCLIRHTETIVFYFQIRCFKDNILESTEHNINRAK